MPAAGHPACWPRGGGYQHMRSASGGPRVLLRRLRETMAEQVSAQERLDKIVVLIAANTLGVRVVQNRAKRTYVEEEVEALQTTAMVLAEMIASGELSALAQPGAEPAARHSVHKTGAILSDGIALGHVVLHEPRVVINNYIAEDLPKELKR